jgi:hypothetical protein
VKIGRTREIYARHKIVYFKKQSKGTRFKIWDWHGTSQGKPRPVVPVARVWIYLGLPLF